MKSRRRLKAVCRNLLADQASVDGHDGCEGLDRNLNSLSALPSVVKHFEPLGSFLSELLTLREDSINAFWSQIKTLGYFTNRSRGLPPYPADLLVSVHDSLEVSYSTDGYHTSCCLLLLAYPHSLSEGLKFFVCRPSILFLLF